MAKDVIQRLKVSLARFSHILTEAELLQVLAIQEQPLPTGIRLNPLKSEPSAAIQDLVERYHWQVKPISFCENAHSIESAEIPPGQTIEHRLGQFYLQDASSMVPVSLFDLSETPLLVLDMAASPGGKTTHLVDRTADLAFILANDASRSRIPALRSVLATWGGVNQMVTNFPGESFGSWYPDTFDIILLDAPCSMESLRLSPNHPLRETTPSERLRLQDRQVQLLISGLRALKPGGQMVYATCSLAPEEDEAVIDRVLKDYPKGFVIEDVSEKIPYQASGLKAFADQVYHPSLAQSLRLWPHLTGMSGFFCARLKKVNPIPTSPAPPPNRDFSSTHLVSVTPAVQSQIFNHVHDRFGLNPDEVISQYHLKLFQRHEKLFLIPEMYVQEFRTLPFEFIGMQVGSWSEEVLQPSHEFISRFGHDFTRGKIEIDPTQVDQWIAGRDIRNPQTDLPPQGQFLLVVDEVGRNLGMGKLLPKRLRNMLPRGSI
jgi:16S rRNA (cytosine1407-C5)-methyltransferase